MKSFDRQVWFKVLYFFFWAIMLYFCRTGITKSLYCSTILLMMVASSCPMSASTDRHSGMPTMAYTCREADIFCRYFQIFLPCRSRGRRRWRGRCGRTRWWWGWWWWRTRTGWSPSSWWSSGPIRVKYCSHLTNQKRVYSIPSQSQLTWSTTSMPASTHSDNTPS